jgi:BolA protein
MSADRVKMIERRLSEAFDPESMLVKDQSHLHAGHAGAEGGMGHFEVQIVAAAFEGLSRIQRHRKVYEAVGSLMETDIHALSVKAFAPNER